MRKRIQALAAVLLLSLLAGACAGGDALENEGSAGGDGGSEAMTSEGGSGVSGDVIIGSANFTEQLILANAYGLVIEDLGVPVEYRLNLGSREIVFPALRSGEITLLPEYNGALLAFLQGSEVEANSPEEVTAALREELPEDIVALDPSDAQDKDGLAVTQETAEEYGLETYSDLADVAGELVVGGPPEMQERGVGLPGLQEVYGIEFADFRSLDAGGPLTSEALNSGQIDVARVFTTQGAINENNWVLLEDDQELAPAQNIIPVAQESIITEEIRTALNELSATLTTEDLTELNRLVDVETQEPATVAEEYLIEQGLIGS